MAMDKWVRTTCIYFSAVMIEFTAIFTKLNNISTAVRAALICLFTGRSVANSAFLSLVCDQIELHQFKSSEKLRKVQPV